VIVAPVRGQSCKNSASGGAVFALTKHPKQTGRSLKQSRKAAKPQSRKPLIISGLIQNNFSGAFQQLTFVF
jgi:hypothetical protein